MAAKGRNDKRATIPGGSRNPGTGYSDLLAGPVTFLLTVRLLARL
jgi:hypothetical protein